jgi:putative tryptophan/tyrosine transport system substrate-binding protein
MRRRDFIAGVGSAAAWPVVARAQQKGPMRRIGVLVSTLAADNPAWQARNTAFVQGLQQLGWTAGRNVEIDYRWGLGDDERRRKSASELVALMPDVLLAAGTPALPVLQQATRTLPIVFANVVDPVGDGFLASLARPGGNATGFMTNEYAMGGKWLQLLMQITPAVTRVRVLRNSGGVAQFAAIQAAAASVRLEVSPVNSGDADEVERAVTGVGGRSNGGLIVLAAGMPIEQRDLIIALAARHLLPAVYSERFMVTRGGLISYDTDIFDLYRQAAGYVDRILKGEKPADLPVQVPTKYETVLNLKTAKALGLTIPETLLATADEVIQ